MFDTSAGAGDSYCERMALLSSPLSWYPKVFTADVATYSSLGIKHITSLGCGIDKYYYDTHGEPPIKEYGNGLLLIGNKE